MSIIRDGGDIHHHGLLAGVSAAALAVIVIPLLALLLARHVMTEAFTAVIWILVVLIAAAGLAAVLYVFRLVWHKHVQFSAAAPVRMRAEVISDTPAAVTADVVPGLAPAPVHPVRPAEVHLHLPEGMDPAQVAVLLAGLRERAAELVPPE